MLNPFESMSTAGKNLRSLKTRMACRLNCMNPIRISVHV